MTIQFLVVHPAAFDLGRTVILLAFLVLAIGIASCFTGAILVPSAVWFAAAIPVFAVGGILVGCSLTRM